MCHDVRPVAVANGSGAPRSCCVPVPSDVGQRIRDSPYPIRLTRAGPYRRGYCTCWPIRLAMWVSGDHYDCGSMRFGDKAVARVMCARNSRVPSCG